MTLYTFGPQRNQRGYYREGGPSPLELAGDDVGPHKELWVRESIAKLLQLLNDGDEVEINEINATGGADWIAPETHGFSYFGVVLEPPEFVKTENVRDQIKSLTVHHSKWMPVMQEFSGLVVKTEAVVGQIMLAGATFGFPLDYRRGDDECPDALLVRAWRTE